MKGKLIVIIGLVLLFAWFGAGTGQELTYQGVGVCQNCHSDPPAGSAPIVFPFWQQTAHAVAFDSAGAFVQNTAECLQCHTTGWDTTMANGGSDDFLTINMDGSVTIDNQTEFDKKKNVQCESCHGPGSAHVTGAFSGVVPPMDPAEAETCGQCHQGEHTPYLENWLESKHAISDTNANANLANNFRNNPNCSGCHTFQGFIQFVGTTLEDTTNIIPNVEAPGDSAKPIVCAACHDPHDAKHEGQLRIDLVDLCVKCHNPEDAMPPEVPHHSTASMFAGVDAVEFSGYTYRTQSTHQVFGATAEKKCVACHVYMTPFSDNGTPNDPTDDILANTGHTFFPRIEACMQSGCHESGLDIPAGSQLEFDHRGRRTLTMNLIDSLATIIAEIETDILPTATPEDSAKYQDGLFNLEYAQNEGSMGVHNPFYAEDVLKNTISYLLANFPVSVEPTGNPLSGIPTAFALHQNYPNPFNPTTKISFDVPKAGHVKLVIYNSLGQEVETLIDKQLTPNSYEVDFNASNLSSGLYFYKIVSDNFISTKKMLLLK